MESKRYRTTDRGRTWSSRLDGVPHDGDDWGQAKVDSVTVVVSPKLSQHATQSSSSSSAAAAAAASPATAEIYMTTEGAGLWHSTYDPLDTDGGLRFTQLVAYPFSHPTRVVQNPHVRSELWVTSFGNGLYTGVAS
jgi:hypothetical protein